jgi:hypothetical protein
MMRHCTYAIDILQLSWSAMWSITSLADFSVSFSPIHSCTYATTRNILNVPTGDTFCRIFLHQLVNAPVNVVKTLEIVLCSSRDGVPLGLEKDTCRQTSLSKWID